jgi:uncharacterized protein
MNGTNRKYWVLLTVALVLMICGSLLSSWIITGAGAATLKDVKFRGAHGNVISAYLWTPTSATSAKPAPGILAVHGADNSKEFMANGAIELARRGYVVLSIDMGGSGYSEWDTASNTLDSLTYLRSLTNVDKNNIGMVGMSLGGIQISGVGRTSKDYNAIFLMESTCGAVTACASLKNTAVQWSLAEELTAFGAPTSRQLPDSKDLQKFFGTTETVKVGQTYGSISEGTARILYQPSGEHAMSHDDPQTMGNLVEWFGKTLAGGTALPRTDVIFGWKVLGTTAALAGAVLFMFMFGALLLSTSYFKPLVETVPEYKGLKGIGWWIGAVITAALGPLLWNWAYIQSATVVRANSLWPQGLTNGHMLWAVVIGVIDILLILLNHFVFTKKQGASAVNYGLASEGKGLEWGKIARSFLLVTCVLGTLYILLLFINTVWKVDFRFWIWALKPMSPARFQAFLGYLIPFAILFIPQGIIFAGFLRANNGKLSVGREILVNAAVYVAGVVALLLWYYIPIFSGQPSPDATFKSLFFVPFLLIMPLIACLYTYFFHKTGRVYVGIFFVTLFIVWYMAAFSSFSILP